MNPKAEKYHGNHNAMHQAPAPEDVIIGELYSFSFNPSRTPKDGHLGKFINDMHTFIDGLNNCTIDMSPELSRMGRLHFHGVITIDKIIEFYLYDLHKLKDAGTFEIDTIQDIVKWNEYVYKQSKLMIIFLNKEISTNKCCYRLRTKSRAVRPLKEFGATCSSASWTADLSDD